MARIAGVELDKEKKIWIALAKIYGIGKSRSLFILKKLNIDPFKKTKDLTSSEISNIQSFIEKNYKIEGELKREQLMAIKKLKELGTWRGLRHIKKLPVRGQRTRTNTRTVRGNVRKTVGSGKKPGPAPK